MTTPFAEFAGQVLEQRKCSMSTDQERGIYSKYRVQRLDDYAGKHNDCPVFVLDPVHDPHARVAMLAYADACQAEFPQLAADLRGRTEGTAA